MTGAATAALVTWAVLTAACLLTWLPPPPRPARPPLSRAPVLVLIVLLVVLGTAAVAVLAAVSGPVSGGWSWFAIGLGAAAAVVCGGSVTTAVLGLADAGSRTPAARVHRTGLRGGAWIGALERLGLVATVLAGWPEGIGVIIAVKGLARYPELKATPASGLTERFIIGTFASLGWGAACAGVLVIMT